MKINRRGLLAGVAGLGGFFVLSACTDNDGEPEVETETPDLKQMKFEEIKEAPIYEEGALIFGDISSANIVTVVLDFASPESAEFFNTHSETMKSFYFQSDRRLEVVLLSPPNEDGLPDLSSYSSETSAMGTLVYMRDQARFWEYAQTIFNREEKSIETDELLQIGKEFGVDSEDVRSEMAGTWLFLDEMNIKSMIYTDDFNSPLIAVDESLWDGDINNSDEVNDLFANVGE